MSVLKEGYYRSETRFRAYLQKLQFNKGIPEKLKSLIEKPIQEPPSAKNQQQGHKESTAAYKSSAVIKAHFKKIKKTIA